MPGVIGHRGTTVLPIKWGPVSQENGSRFITGIAYNAAIKGERRRITCSEKTWDDPDDDVFYWDEAIRWTESELSKMNLRGKPVCVMHQSLDDLPPVGEIITNFTDDQGNLHIVAELPGKDPYGKAAISLVDNDICSQLSVGYNLLRDPRTGVVYHGDIDEVSIVDKAHFRGCQVAVKANKKNVKITEEPYTIYRAVRDIDELIQAASAKSTKTVMAEASTPAAVAPATTTQAAAAAAPSATTTPTLNDLAAFKKILLEAEAKEKKAQADAEALKAELEKAKERLGTIDEAEKKRKTEYIEKYTPRAKEIIDEMKSIAKEQGIDNLSQSWETLTMNILTDPKDVSQEMQAVQVACARGMRGLKKENDEIKAKLAMYEQGLQEANAIASVGGAIDNERYERREVKAGLRAKATAADSTGMMEADTSDSVIVNLPEWAREYAQNVHNPSGGYVLPRDQRKGLQSRGVQARLSTPVGTQTQSVPTPAVQQHVPVQKQAPVQQQQQQPMYQQVPVRQQEPQAKWEPWRVRTQHSMSNDPHTRDNFNFIQSKVASTNHVSGALITLSGARFIPKNPGSGNY